MGIRGDLGATTPREPDDDLPADAGPRDSRPPEAGAHEERSAETGAPDGWSADAERSGGRSAAPLRWWPTLLGEQEVRRPAGTGWATERGDLCAPDNDRADASGDSPGSQDTATSPDGTRPGDVPGPVDGVGPVVGLTSVEDTGPDAGLKSVEDTGPVDGVRPVVGLRSVEDTGPVDGVRPVGGLSAVEDTGPVDGGHPVAGLRPVDGVDPAAGSNRADSPDRDAGSNPAVGLPPTAGSHPAAVTGRFPGVSRLADRETRFSEYEIRLCQRVSRKLGHSAEQVEALVTDLDGRHARLFAELRAGGTRLDLESLVREIDELASMRVLGLPTELLARIQGGAERTNLEILIREVDRQIAVQALCLPVELFDDCPSDLIDAWCTHGAACTPDELLAMPRAVRLTLLAALCAVRRRETADMLVAVLIGLVHQLHARIEARFEQSLPQDPWLERERHALLPKLLGAALDRPDEPVRSVLYPLVSEKTMRELVKDAATREAMHVRRKRAVLRSTYSSPYQQVLALLLTALEFRCTDPACWPVMAALGELVDDCMVCWGKGRYYDAGQSLPVDGVVPESWRPAVFDAEGRIERVPYGLCVLLSLRDMLSRRRVHIAGAGRWGRPPETREPEPVGATPTYHGLRPVRGDVIDWPSGADE
ncbi:hypothetical protein GCM10009533_37270 [Saccharopolyspora spinosporotrichia]|uniref:Uncharacterized protein n=1 Tax=Saccharopolyspora erythraea TaxID=1836 RepID=A0ABN1D5G1_SACER|nr:hypothetical protein N599_09240 [Saccharopolyspora erythraea D]